MSQLVILGLDCATPQLVFDAWLDDLPAIKSLVEAGGGARLRSTIPPITVPAWTAMMTSKDPGQLGFYGFRNRKSYGYEDLYFANALYVKEKTVWNYLSRSRLKSLVMGVPQTYPPKPLNGVMVASFLTPNKQVQYTYPDEVKEELDRAAGGEYIIDVEEFRTEDKDRLIAQINEMTRRRFAAFRHLLARDRYDFAIMVEMGIDRVHHGFWRYHDRSHRLYEPGSPYQQVIFDHYRMVDAEIAQTLEALDDDAAVLVVSDHGAKGMMGAICVNEWLQERGYLALQARPAEQQRLKMDMIDWPRTRAWGEGGYYGRVFLNVEGREPQGVVPQSEYAAFRDRLAAELEAISDESGRPIGTRVFKAEEVYREVKNIPPDLIVYFGDLDWRSAGSVGVGSVYLYENDTGPDDANHSQDGILAWRLPPGLTIPQRDVYSIYDIAPTVLRYFDLEVPDDMIGTALIERG